MAGRRQALQRRSRAGSAIRRHAHGPDLRQPRRPQRERRLHGRRQGHPRHVRPHGDERRGDRRAHRGRSHLRQVPRRGPRIPQGPGPGSRSARSAGSWLEERLPQRARRRHDLERHRGDLDQDPGAVEQQLPREPLQVRMGADQVARRCQAMGGEECAGDHSRRAHSGKASQADDADHRLHAALRPGVRQDLAPVPRGSAGLRRRLRARLVQADASRHGPARPLSGTGGAGRGTDLAGPHPGRRPRADRRAGHRRAQGQGACLGALGVAARLDRLGGGIHLPRLRQARRRQRRAHPPRTTEGLGGQPAGRAGQGPEDDSRVSRPSSTRTGKAARRCRWPT